MACNLTLPGGLQGGWWFSGTHAAAVSCVGCPQRYPPTLHNRGTCHHHMITELVITLLHIEINHVGLNVNKFFFDNLLKVSIDYDFVNICSEIRNFT